MGKKHMMRRAAVALRKYRAKPLREMTPIELYREWQLADAIREVEELLVPDEPATEDAKMDRIGKRARNRRRDIDAHLAGRVNDPKNPLRTRDDFAAAMNMADSIIDDEWQFASRDDAARVKALLELVRYSAEAIAEPA
jgi:hypothetical protein